MAMDLVPEEQSFKDSIRDANKFLINFKKDSNMLVTMLDHLLGCSMDLDVLKETGIGKTVNGLKKHPNEQVCAKSKELVTKWKDLTNDYIVKNKLKVKPKTEKAKHTDSTAINEELSQRYDVGVKVKKEPTDNQDRIMTHSSGHSSPAEEKFTIVSGKRERMARLQNRDEVKVKIEKDAPETKTERNGEISMMKIPKKRAEPLMKTESDMSPNQSESRKHKIPAESLERTPTEAKKIKVEKVEGPKDRSSHGRHEKDSKREKERKQEKDSKKDKEKREEKDKKHKDHHKHEKDGIHEKHTKHKHSKHKDDKKDRKKDRDRDKEKKETSGDSKHEKSKLHTLSSPPTDIQEIQDTLQTLIDQAKQFSQPEEKKVVKLTGYRLWKAEKEQREKQAAEEANYGKLDVPVDNQTEKRVASWVLSASPTAPPPSISPEPYPHNGAHTEQEFPIPKTNPDTPPRLDRTPPNVWADEPKSKDKSIFSKIKKLPGHNSRPPPPPSATVTNSANHVPRYHDESKSISEPHRNPGCQSQSPQTSRKERDSHQKDKEHRKEKEHKSHRDVYQDGKRSSHRSRSHHSSNNDSSHRKEKEHKSSKSHKKDKYKDKSHSGKRKSESKEASFESTLLAPPPEKRKASVATELKPLPKDYLDNLPELRTDYKPLPRVSQGIVNSHTRQKGGTYNTSETVGLTSKTHSREAVYSGRKRGATTMMPLFQLCLRTLMNNIDDLGYVGGVPYYILQPVLERATATQLFTIEEYNPEFTTESDDLWKVHCARDFKGAQLEEFESHRELYLRKFEEREAKLEALKNRISAQEQKKNEDAKRSKTAYAMASMPKPPRDVRIKQAKYGTGSGSMASTARAAQAMREAAQNRSHHTSGRHSIAKVKKIAPPLMQKTKKFISKMSYF